MQKRARIGYASAVQAEQTPPAVKLVKITTLFGRNYCIMSTCAKIANTGSVVSWALFSRPITVWVAYSTSCQFETARYNVGRYGECGLIK